MNSRDAERTALASVGTALGVDIGAAQIERLLDYLDLLDRWNGVYNLSAIRDREAMRTQHLADCLAVVPALRRRGTRGPLLDVGSGGGLPGVVIAVLMPEVQVVCVDAVAKKAAFIRQAAGHLSLANLQAQHGRVEDLRLPKADTIVSRAFASLERFVSLTEGHLAADGAWMAMKGQVPHEEIADMPTTVRVFHVEHVEVPGLDAARCLVWMQRAADGAHRIEGNLR